MPVSALEQVILVCLFRVFLLVIFWSFSVWLRSFIAIFNTLQVLYASVHSVLEIYSRVVHRVAMTIFIFYVTCYYALTAVSRDLQRLRLGSNECPDVDERIMHTPICLYPSYNLQGSAMKSRKMLCSVANNSICPFSSDVSHVFIRYRE